MQILQSYYKLFILSKVGLNLGFIIAFKLNNFINMHVRILL